MILPRRSCPAILSTPLSAQLTLTDAEPQGSGPTDTCTNEWTTYMASTRYGNLRPDDAQIQVMRLQSCFRGSESCYFQICSLPNLGSCDMSMGHGRMMPAWVVILSLLCFLVSLKTRQRETSSVIRMSRCSLGLDHVSSRACITPYPTLYRRAIRR